MSMTELNGYCDLNSSDDTLLEPDLEAIERDHMTKAKNIMKANFNPITQKLHKTPSLLLLGGRSCNR
jgi:hypothetical protein